MKALYRFCVFGILWLVFSLLALFYAAHYPWPLGLFASAVMAWVALWGLKATHWIRIACLQSGLGETWRAFTSAATSR